MKENRRSRRRETRNTHVYWLWDRPNQPRYETRSVTRRRREQTPFDLLGLPEDIIRKIMVRVGEEDMQDLRHSRITCTRLNDITTGASFFAFVNLMEMNNYVWCPGFDWKKFYRRCYDEGYPTAVSLKGISNLFFENKRVEGLEQIKAAADKGSFFSEYIYGMMSNLYRDDWEEGLFGNHHLTRERETQLRSKLSTPDWIIVKRDQNEPHLISFCNCSEIDPWQRWWGEPKGDDMCESCFWILEVAFFCRMVDDHFTVF